MKNNKKSNKNELLEKLKGDPKKPLYKKWYFWVGLVFILALIGGACSTGDQPTNDDKNVESAKTEEKKASKWSEMTLGDRKSLVETACEDTATPLVNSSKIDVISLRYLWDSWTSAYGDGWSAESKKVADGPVIGHTKGGLPIYNYRWSGNYREDKGKSKVNFDCWLSVDENDNNKVNIIWLNLDGIDLWKSKADLDYQLSE